MEIEVIGRNANVRPVQSSFGLSGAVRQLDRMSLPLARAFLPCSRIRFPRVLRVWFPQEGGKNSGERIPSGGVAGR